MPSSGTGTGTPISGGVGLGVLPSREIPRTILSLDRYAKIIGIPPAHFWGAYAASLDPAVFPIACDSIWFQYPWQNADRISRSEIAEAIKVAEDDLAKAVGYWPGLYFIESERVRYTGPYRPEYVGRGIDARGFVKSVDTRWKKVTNIGRRAVSLVGTATVASGSLVYSDEDGDGLYETASITLPTTLTDPQEIKVYQSGHNGEEKYEIRDVISVTISGGNVVIALDSWLLIEPELYEVYPTDLGVPAVDISTTANFVASVDVYREYVDTTQPAVVFEWEPEAVSCLSGTDPVTTLTQNGFGRIRDSENGIVVPVPADYDATTQKWVAKDWQNGSVVREPDYLTLHYRSGDVSDEFARSLSHDSLSIFWAQTIAWLATSRLDRPVCGCKGVASLQSWLMTDISQNTREQTFFNPEEILDNPFGTRRGEIAAWRRISKLVPRHFNVAFA